MEWVYAGIDTHMLTYLLTCPQTHTGQNTNKKSNIMPTPMHRAASSDHHIASRQLISNVPATYSPPTLSTHAEQHSGIHNIVTYSMHNTMVNKCTVPCLNSILITFKQMTASSSHWKNYLQLQCYDKSWQPYALQSSGISHLQLDLKWFRFQHEAVMGIFIGL